MMTAIMTISSTDASYDIRYILVDGEPWFKGCLLYTSPSPRD